MKWDIILFWGGYLFVIGATFLIGPPAMVMAVGLSSMVLGCAMSGVTADDTKEKTDEY
jgi:hypothetical protein